jgi:predicted ester cyclase
MAVEANKTVVHRFFSDLNAGDLHHLATLLAPSYTVHVPGHPRPLDWSEFQQYAGGYFAAFPDLSHTVEDMIANEFRVAVRLTIRGTHQGELLSIASTGRRIETTAINMFYISGGKIAEHWIETDFLGPGLLQQLGTISSPVRAGV